jgi:cytoskeleton protein RodZ
MTPIGETLRRERLKRNLDLEQISRELKISTHTLEAIENEQFDHLPGAIFAKSFVKQYARILELDDAEMAAQVQSRFEPEPLPTFETVSKAPLGMAVKVPGLRSGGPAWKSIFLRLAMLALIVLVTSGIYVFWQQSRATQMARRSAIQQPSAQVSAPQIPSAPQSAAPVPDTQTAAPGDVQQADRALANGVLQASPAPAASIPSAVASAPIQQTSATPNSSPSDAIRLKLTAQEPVWVRASNNGKFMFSGTIEPGQPKEIDATGQVELLLGNAGGINIDLNGKPIGPFGPKGQVRTVHLTSGGFNIVPPKPAAPVDRF